MKKKLLATLLLMVMTVATPLTAYARPVNMRGEGDNYDWAGYRKEELVYDGSGNAVGKKTSYVENDPHWLAMMEFLNIFDNYNNFKVAADITIMRGDNVADFNDTSKWYDANDRKDLRAQLGGTLDNGERYVRNLSPDTDDLVEISTSHYVFDSDNEFSLCVAPAIHYAPDGNGTTGELSESDIQLICSYLTNPKVTHQINDKYHTTCVNAAHLLYEDYITIEGTLRTGNKFHMEYSNNYFDETYQYFDHEGQVCYGGGYASVTIPNNKIPNWRNLPTDEQVMYEGYRQ